jgi:prephenate dehydrogenase
MIFDRIAIIGANPIGASIARAAREQGAVNDRDL